MIDELSGMIMLNINGLYPKSNQTKVPFLCELSKQSKPLFMFIMESHLNADILDADIDIDGYTVTRTDRADCDHGGVCIYIQDRLASTVLYTNSNTVCEILILKIVSLDLVLCLMYRPPDCKQHELLPCIEKIRNILRNHEDSKIVLLGDMNFPKIDWTDTANPKLPPMTEQNDHKIQITALLELTDEFVLHQLVSKPTRGENVLDLAFSNITSDLIDCHNKV